MGLSGGLLREKSETCACRHDRGDGAEVFEKSGVLTEIDLVECEENEGVVGNMAVGYCDDGSWGKDRS